MQQTLQAPIVTFSLRTMGLSVARPTILTDRPIKDVSIIVSLTPLVIHVLIKSSGYIPSTHNSLWVAYCIIWPKACGGRKRWRISMPWNNKDRDPVCTIHFAPWVLIISKFLQLGLVCQMNMQHTTLMHHRRNTCNDMLCRCNMQCTLNHHATSKQQCHIPQLLPSAECNSWEVCDCSWFDWRPYSLHAMRALGHELWLTTSELVDTHIEYRMHNQWSI